MLLLSFSRYCRRRFLSLRFAYYADIFMPMMLTLMPLLLLPFAA